MQLKSLLFMGLAGLLITCSDPKEQAPGDTNYPIVTEMDKFSYALGVSMTSQMAQLEAAGLDSLNVDLYLQAVRQTILKKELLIPIDESNMFVQTYIQAMRTRWMEENKDKLNKASTGTGPGI